MARCWGIIGGLKTGLKRCKREGRFKLYCHQHRLQPFWLILLIALSILPIYSGTIKPTIEYIWNEINIIEVKFEPFNEDTFGILVAEFEGNTKEQKETGKEVQNTIAGTLNARFEELGLLNADAREISIAQHPSLKAHKTAREIGRNYNAEIVIWGDITLAGVIPNITIVNPRSPMTIVSQPDITLLKDTLLHTAIDDIDNIRFPALTDEPTLLFSFLTGVKYYYKSN